MRRASKAGHSISLTFFNTYAICLFKSQSKNEKKKKIFLKTSVVQNFVNWPHFGQ